MRNHQGSSSAGLDQSRGVSRHQVLHQPHAGAKCHPAEGAADTDQRRPEDDAGQFLVLGGVQCSATHSLEAIEQTRAELQDGFNHG